MYDSPATQCQLQCDEHTGSANVHVLTAMFLTVHQRGESTWVKKKMWDGRASSLRIRRLGEYCWIWQTWKLHPAIFWIIIS